MTDVVPCAECAFASDPWLPARPATVWWHKGLHDEVYVCRRCYSRLLMRARRGSRGREESF